METWKNVVGQENRYEVSDLGHIRRKETGRLLKGTVVGNGYVHVTFSMGKRHVTKQALVHIVVAEAFIGPCPAGMEVNHIDTNKANCAASNLEYLTHSDNQKHAFKMGRSRLPKGEDHPTTYFKDDDIREIKRLAANGLSQYKIAAQFNAPRTTIQSILNGKSWSHITIGVSQMNSNIVPTNNNLPTQPNRQPISAQELWDLVDAELLVQKAAKNTFTAYTITKVIRANHPELEIVHEEVQARVHFQMEFDPDYEMDLQDWNGVMAKTYYPIGTGPNSLFGAAVQNVQVAPTATVQPAQPLPPGTILIDWTSNDPNAPV